MRQLPVSQTIAHMISSTFNNLGFALKAQWPWFVVMAAAFTAVTAMLGPEVLADETKLKAYIEANPGQAALLLFGMIAGVLLFSLAFSSIAVNWHRYVLLDEVPQNLSAKLRVDGTVWRYLGNLILISLVAVLAILPLALISALLVSFSTIILVPAAVAYTLLVVVPIVYRLSIKLPAIAVGREDFKMADAWNVSRGNWWQIVGVSIVFSLISWAVGLVVMLVSSLLQTLFGPTLGFGIDFTMQVIINWILTVMGITMFTSLYGFFEEKRDF